MKIIVSVKINNYHIITGTINKVQICYLFKKELNTYKNLLISIITFRLIIDTLHQGIAAQNYKIIVCNTQVCDTVYF